MRDVEAWLQAAGFRDVRVTVKPESRDLAASSAPGRGNESDVPSATIEARKPRRTACSASSCGESRTTLAARCSSAGNSAGSILAERLLHQLSKDASSLNALWYSVFVFWLEFGGLNPHKPLDYAAELQNRSDIKSDGLRFYPGPATR